MKLGSSNGIFFFETSAELPNIELYPYNTQPVTALSYTLVGDVFILFENQKFLVFIP